MRAWKVISSQIKDDGEAMEVEFVDKESPVSHFWITLPAHLWADTFSMDMALHDKDRIIYWYSNELRKANERALGK